MKLMYIIFYDGFVPLHLRVCVALSVSERSSSILITPLPQPSLNGGNTTITAGGEIGNLGVHHNLLEYKE